MKKLTSLLPVAAILATLLSSCNGFTPPPVQRPLYLGAPMSVVDTGDSDLRFVDQDAGSIIGSGYDYTYPYSPRTAYYYGGRLDDGSNFHNGTYYPGSYYYKGVSDRRVGGPDTSPK